MKIARREFIGGICASALAAMPSGRVFASERPKRWYKGNIHTHTLVSDGRAFPLESALLYRDIGYDFLMFSDHNLLHDRELWIAKKTHKRKRFEEENARRFAAKYPKYAPATKPGPNGETAWRLAPFEETAAIVNDPGRFLLMQGCEYNDVLAGGVQLHCNVINTPRIAHRCSRVAGLDAAFDNMYGNFRKISDESDSFFMVNHPIWWFYDVDPRKMASVEWERAKFFEVSNNPGPDGLMRKHLPNDRELMANLYTEEQLWDFVLANRLSRKGPILYGTGTDDTHSYTKFYDLLATGKEFFRSWVCVRSEELSANALVAAMKRGDFYTANGTVPVELKDIRFEDGTLSVEVDPKPGIDYRIQFFGTKRGADLACLGEKVYDLREMHVRLKNCGKFPAYAGEKRTVPILPKTVGVTLAEVAGTRASYRLKDDDLYVRAKVTTAGGVALTQPYVTCYAHC